MNKLLNTCLGPYKIAASLGRGAMATVYKAYQPTMERYVALKVLLPHYADDPHFAGRFEQEAKILAQLQHPYILPVYDYGQADGYSYIVMPYIQGGTLTNLMPGRPLPLKQIRSLMTQLGDALDYAHSHGLLHRDVKPANVLIDERGNCLLTDFGIAKIIGGAANFTAAGSIIGTPAYMSPEQGLGQKLDGRSDLYALAVMLYEMATGQVPFMAETPMAVISQHIHDPLPRPRSLNPALPVVLEAVINKALAKNMLKRYPTAANFVQAVKNAIPESPAVEAAPSTSSAASIRSAPSLPQLIARWQTDPGFMDKVADWRTLPAIPATFANWPEDLDDRVIAGAKSLGFDRPYSHQAQAIEAALKGNHVVMVTGTASGKTLGYNAPILHTLLQDPAARALYLFPTKALAQDQMVAFNQLAAAIGRPAPQAATYDGDTPQSARKKIRQTHRVIITNPDMLHSGILPHHPRWRTFLANLRYLVIDEMHIYRGVFGSHFANVLRRLHRLCAFYGADPQFICASATIANPHQHALALLDLVEPHRLQVVTENGAPRVKKHIIFYNPPIIDKQLGMRRGVVVTANDLARQLLASQAQTAIFARTRLIVEVLLTYLRDFAREKHWLAETVRGYRGGYLPLVRREIEAGLREGTVKGVVATNALELGVDIGGLNACVLTGYPGTIASTWQQIGRAGRRHGQSVAVMVASQAPLDQFLMAHSNFFFDRSTEHARIDPDNLMIVLGHLQCAVYELPFQADEPYGLFPNPTDVLNHLVSEGLLRESAGRYHWMGETYPAETVNLRSTGINNVAITVKQEGGDVITIGEIDITSAPSLVYPGAIYLHEGESYQITALDLEGGRAKATPVEVGYYTRSITKTEIKVLTEAETDQSDLLHRSRGEVEVSSQVIGFRQIRRYTHETLGYSDLDLPVQAFETSAYWLTLADETLDKLRASGLWRQDRLNYGPADLWQHRRNAARARDGYRCRRCNAPEPLDRQHDVHHIRPLRLFLEEAAREGVDLSLVYPRAHALANLMTLCPACHRRAEVIVQTVNAWAGLAHALHNLASIFLMCDPRDIGVAYESAPGAETRPTITLYDTIPLGLGFSDQLYDLHHDLIQAARTLVRNCTCRHGCPACVGPPPSEGLDLRGETKTLLEAVIDS